MADAEFIEADLTADERDPDEMFDRERDVSTQPYDLIVQTLVQQIENKTLFLQPSFQRGYVWPNAIASKLIESIILNIPIPPCYLSQNEDYEIDVIDGQQRLTSIYRFVKNEFFITGLVILRELNGKRFHELSAKLQRKIQSHTIRCVVINHESSSDVKFEVFERLNTNTSPLNAQELRNSLYRSPLNDKLKELSKETRWLRILGRKTPDKRMRDAELILRFVAFRYMGLSSYRTPMKNWLNDAAKTARRWDQNNINEFCDDWDRSISNCLDWFDPNECFRKKGSTAVNKGIFDLLTTFAADVPREKAIRGREEIRGAYYDLLSNEEYIDIVSRSVDHKKRTVDRFRMWNERMSGIF